MMYAKLIFKNAKRSGKDYLIYIVTMTLCVTLFYAFFCLSAAPIIIRPLVRNIIFPCWLEV